jgi:hypothetical protein
MAVRLLAVRAGRPLPPGRFLVLISVRSWVEHKAIAQLEALRQLKNPMISGIEPTTFRLDNWLFSTEPFFVTTLKGPPTKHSLYCWGVFTDPLPSNGFIRHCCVTGSEYDALTISIDGCTTAPCSLVAGSSTTVTSSFKAGKSWEKCRICLNTVSTSIFQILPQRSYTTNICTVVTRNYFGQGIYTRWKALHCIQCLQTGSILNRTGCCVVQPLY